MDSFQVTVTVPSNTPFTILYGASDPDGVQFLSGSYSFSYTSSNGPAGSTLSGDGILAASTFGRQCPLGSRLGKSWEHHWTKEDIEYDFTATASDYNSNRATTPILAVLKGP